MTTTPCVGSGFCCKRAPCPFGTWDASAHQCVHLVPWPDDALIDADGPVPRYRCAKHDEIAMHPLANIAPAFGAGCCQPLFNVERNRILRALNRRPNATDTDTANTKPRTPPSSA